MFLWFMHIHTNFASITVIANHVSLSWLTLWVLFRSPIIYHQKRKGTIVVVDYHVKFPSQFINKFNLQCSFSQIGLKHRFVARASKFCPSSNWYWHQRKWVGFSKKKKTTTTTKAKQKTQHRTSFKTKNISWKSKKPEPSDFYLERYNSIYQILGTREIYRA